MRVSPVAAALGVSAALLAPMLGVALLNAWTAPRLARGGPPRRRPQVSVLVPARDEEANLRRTLPALLAQRYPALEILVLDDASADATADVVTALAAAPAEAALRLLRGAPLPEGWLGKCWACHQLAAAAQGEVLVFCDADVAAAPDAVERTVALLERYHADAATALPRQELRGWAEHAVVPIVAQLPVLAMLPLRLVPATAAPSLSMGNGQWFAFTRDAYSRFGGHAAVRGSVLEDVALARLVKATGMRLVAALAPRTLSVRMYDTPAALREGFGKNLYALLGGTPAGLAIGTAAFSLTAILPWAALAAAPAAAALPLLLLTALRTVGAGTLRHGATSVALHPLGAVLALGLAVESAVRTRRGTVRWRGRAVQQVVATAQQ